MEPGVPAETARAAIINPTAPSPMSIEQCIVAWLHEKAGRSESSKTRIAYHDTMEAFRAALLASGSDLNGLLSTVALAAQGWAASSKRGVQVAPKTYNQRLAILSSFYRYTIKHEVLTSNPIERVARRKDEARDPALPLPGSAVHHGLSHINRKTLEGKRDYALLSVALATGRRVSELASLRYGHLQWTGEICTVRWIRCKGNRKMTDELPEKTTRVLYDYLQAVYGEELATLPPTAPVWISLSDKNHGQAIAHRTIQRICDKHLGTSKMHATRHTWAVTMNKRGAKLTDIQKGLGHASAHTTSLYMEQQLGYQNAYARDLEDEFGIGAQQEE